MSAFLRSKASNFRAMLETHAETPTARALLESYNDVELELLIKTHLLPLFFTGTLDVAVQRILAEFPSLDPVRVKRYLSCFCECVLT